jgi:hypothetical protein
MKRIGLVSSINGLGHARRLMYLALSFQDIGISTTMFVTQKQIKVLIPELDSLGKKLDFEEILSYGIDGPVWMNNGCLIEIPPKQIIDLIKKCDLIISDNVIWPINFNQKFVLFGHFNWLDYWRIKGESQFSISASNIYLEERDLFKEIEWSLQFKDFKLKGELATKNSIEIKLLKYSSDLFFPLKIDANSVWIAQGTTELYRNYILNYTHDLPFKIFRKETFNLINSQHKPSIVIGRPGLGTIRDCLAAGILFIPTEEDPDPELESNIDNLKSLLPTPTFPINQSNFVEFLEKINSDKLLLEAWANIWPNTSQSCADSCEQILNLSF